MRKLSFAAGLLMVVSSVLGQSPTSAKTRKPGRSHLLVRFAAQPGPDQLNALADRGAAVLSYIPKSTLSVAASDSLSFAGLGAEWVGRLQPAQKISPYLNGALSSTAAIPVVVEFYSDVPSSEARAIATEAGLAIQHHPDLLPTHLLVSGTGSQLLALAQWDEVSYIFPASPALVQGTPVHGCAGALTADGPVEQSVPLIGAWNGTNGESVNLNYAFVYLTQQDPADSVESEMERAYAEWSKVVQVTFSQTTDSTGPQTIAVLFASGAHGDGYPFTGPGGVLAHTFYPYPVNPEPIAGDSHFNNDETWKIGADIDVFSVALHETGHALGLGHSDNPADVMYPYYRMVTGLSPGDIAAVQQLYAVAGTSNNPITPTAPPGLPSPNPPSTPSAVSPLVLTIQPAVTSTSSATFSLSGTTSGGSGTVEVSWSTNQGAGGMAQSSTPGSNSSSWTIPSIPLSVGTNIVTVSAIDSNQDQATQSVAVVELGPAQPTNPPPSNPPPSTGPDTTPPSITILSPPMTSVATSASSIVVSGISSDNVGVSQVTWASSTGGSGTANGTSTWSTGPIPLYVGMTTITIYANDAAGNQSWRSLTVTRN
ncbi:MAG TPA: matrixin family metalloprotease [Bryobacteraceae bacterium]|nr:matrixin family metalloprotease [Bryobacteraceae bacterium]